jgi:hypothetical protein
MTEGLVNHWRHLPEWRPGRHLWAFYLTFGAEPDLHALAQTYRDQLSGIRELDPVDSRWLHVTIQGVAFADELDAGHIDAIEREVSDVLGGQWLPTLSLDPAALDYDAISMHVTPTDEIHCLRAEIRGCVNRAVGDGSLYRLPEPPGGFNPHISIAYANSPMSQTDDIRVRLARVAPPDLQIDVPHVSLVQLRREDRRWFWNHERAIAFRHRVPEPAATVDRGQFSNVAGPAAA